MDSQRWPKILEIFDAATAVSIAQRPGFIEDRCKGDRELFDAVHWLLDQDSQAGSDFLKPPPNDPRIEQLLSEEVQADPLLGQRIGDYTIKRMIARGGMGVVYMAEQTNPRREVALKVMQGGLVSKSALRRFEYESQILAQLHHPNIAQVYEAGVHRPSGLASPDLPYFVLEYIPDARPITQYAGDEALDTPRRLECFVTVCEAVQHGHQKGIIHRDLKPANILIDATGQVKVIDFGVARVTDADIAITTLQSDAGRLIGTLQYMSPEQCAADPHAIDVRSDVYSLGVVLHELLCGKLPYDISHTPVYHAARIIHEQSPARLSAIDRKLKGDLETIVQKALEKDRNRRYASVTEFACDIRRYLNHEPIEARRPTMAYRVRMFARRERGQFIALCAFFLALIGGLVATSVALLHAREAAAEARREKKHAQFQAYAADLYGAESALARYDPGTASRLLDFAKEKLGQSSDDSGMPWEWRHLSSRLDQSISMLVPKANHKQRRNMAIDRPGKWLAVAQNNEEMLSLYDLKTCKDMECVTALKNLESIYPLTLSPDGHWLAAAWLDGPASSAMGPRQQNLGVWEVLQSGRLINRAAANFAHGDFDVAALAFHPQRFVLAATIATGEVRLWDLANQIKTNSVEVALEHSDAAWTAHSRQANGIAFSPDGHLLATGSMDRMVKLWDLSSLDDILTKHELPASVVLLGHTDHVGTVAFSSDGKRLATGSVDQTIRLWDVPGSLQQGKRLDGAHGGICLAVLTGHDGSVNSVAFDETGGRLVSASHDMSIGIWDVRADAPIADASKPYETRRPRQQLICRLRGHTNWVNRAALLGDGQVISCSEDGSVRRWAADTEDVAICREHYSSVYGVAWDPIGSNPRYVASVGADGAIMIWDAALAAPMSRIFLRELESAQGIVCWEGKGSTLMAVATHRIGRDGLEGRLLIYQILDPVRPRRICSLAPCPPGSCAGGYASVAVSQDGSRLAGGTDHGTVQVWDIHEPSAPRLLSTLSGGHAKEDFISGVTFLDTQGIGLASVSSSHYPLAHGGLCIWLVDQEGRTRPLMRDAEAANAVAYDPKRSILAAPTVRHTIRLWEVKRNGEGLRMNRLAQELSGHVAKVNSLTFHPTEPRLVSGGDDRLIKIWDLENFTEAASLRGHLDQIEALAFDPSGQRLASAGQGGLGSDNVVRLWETRRLDSQTQSWRSDLRRAQEELRQIIFDSPVRTPEAAKVEMKKATHIPEQVKREAIDRFETLQLHPEWYYVRVQPELKQPGLIQDRYESAMTWIDAAKKMAPENGNYKTAEGILLYRLGRYRKSIAALEQARQMNNGRFLPDDCFLALANWKIGQNESAKIAYSRAEQLNSDKLKQVGDPAISSIAFAEARDQLDSNLDGPLPTIKPSEPAKSTMEHHGNGSGRGIDAD